MLALALIACSSTDGRAVLPKDAGLLSFYAPVVAEVRDGSTATFGAQLRAQDHILVLVTPREPFPADLSLLDPQGAEIESADLWFEDLQLQEQYVVPADDLYALTVTSRFSTFGGAFELELTCLGGPCLEFVPPNPPEDTGDTADTGLSEDPAGGGG